MGDLDRVLMLLQAGVNPNAQNTVNKWCGGRDGLGWDGLRWAGMG